MIWVADEHGSDDKSAAATTAAASGSTRGSRGLAEGVLAVSAIAAGCQLVRQTETWLDDKVSARGKLIDALSLGASKARSLMGTAVLQRIYTFIAPTVTGGDTEDQQRGVQREVTLAFNSFRSVGGFPAFRRAAHIRRGARVAVAACATSRNHVHIAPVSAAGWEAEPDADAVTPPQTQRRAPGGMKASPAQGPVTVALAICSTTGLFVPQRLLR